LSEAGSPASTRTAAARTETTVVNEQLTLVDVVTNQVLTRQPGPNVTEDQPADVMPCGVPELDHGA
jgi:hypothetical protein